jgi:glycosyltransferase involved in cell wall biosynthesis
MNVIAVDGSVGTLEEAALPTITRRYLLVTNIPLYRSGGHMLAGQLWFKDLVRHVVYLDRLTMACPVLDVSPTEAASPLSADNGLASVRVDELPAASSSFLAVLALPRTLIRLWKAIRKADIVHAGVAGWPIPYGWFVTPIAKILGKKLVIIVESAPWRLNTGRPITLKSAVGSFVFEVLARWCVGRSDLAIFTQENYRDSLLRDRRARGFVIHASWIDEESIISENEAHDVWRRKRNSSSPKLSILFAGRLEPQKGLLVLLDAMRLLALKDLPIQLDILGSGDLAMKCRELSNELKGSTRVEVLGTVAYGAPLFQLLRGYHAVVLPSISDEQPRIVYDAYSQGLPVLATGTTGLQSCVIDGRTGWFAEPNSAVELSRMIERAAANLEEIEAMGMEAVRVARSMTHQRMHRERHRLLVDLIRSPAA